MTFDRNEAVRIAEDAAGLVDAGWCQNTLADGDGAYCAVGAINKAAFGHASLQMTDNWGLVKDIIDKADELAYDLEHSSIVSFNNAETTTQSDVSDLLRRTAKAIANEEEEAA